MNVGGAAEPAEEPRAVSDAVARARKAVEARRRFGLEDGSALLVAARRELQEADEAERATRTPGDLLRRSLGRRPQKTKQVEGLRGKVRELKDSYDQKKAWLTQAEAELTTINSEVAGARAAFMALGTRSTVATDEQSVDDALGRLGKIVSAAPTVTEGSESTYVVSLDEQFNELRESVAKQRGGPSRPGGPAIPGTPAAWDAAIPDTDRDE